MEDKVKGILKTVAFKVPVLDKAYPDVFPCITFHFYGARGGLFAKGKATEETMSCQVDIWYKEKTENIKTTINNIKQAVINEKYFTYPAKDYDLENGTKIHHTFFNFELLETEE